MDVIPSDEMVRIHKEFLDSLKVKTKIKFLKIDNKPHFHSSIAHNDIGDKFSKIFEFVSKKNPQFNCTFNNISILKIEDDLLKIHKEYHLS